MPFTGDKGREHRHVRFPKLPTQCSQVDVEAFAQYSRCAVPICESLNSCCGDHFSQTIWGLGGCTEEPLGDEAANDLCSGRQHRRSLSIVNVVFIGRFQTWHRPIPAKVFRQIVLTDPFQLGTAPPPNKATLRADAAVAFFRPAAARPARSWSGTSVGISTRRATATPRPRRCPRPISWR